MSLRALRDSGHFVQPCSASEGVWTVVGPGELARCPACGRGLMLALAESMVAVRVSEETTEGPAGRVVCPKAQCRATIQVRILPA